jgi:transposase
MEEQQHRQPKQPRTGREFTAEFKRDAAELVRTTGRPITHIARDLGIYDSTLGNWVRQDAIDRGEVEGLTTQERERLRVLEAECGRLRTVGGQEDMITDIAAELARRAATGAGS